MRKKQGEERAPAEDSTLLCQPDLGGGQRPEAAKGRPKGTRPVSAFAGALENDTGPPGASGAWRVEPGEAEAAAEDGVPGSNAVRFSDALDAGVVPGRTAEPPVMVGPGALPDGVRGALYDGPERRKHQLSWELWQRTDRRERPFAYAGDQQV